MESIADAAVPVPGYEGLYAITKNGVVFSLPRTTTKKLSIMNPVDNMNGSYLRVVLSKEGHTKLWYIHRLVALAFISNPGNNDVAQY